jgi:PAS domain S-box-containing protein
MGERIRAFNWARTALGPVEGWSNALKTTLRIMLASQQPIWVGWGPELVYLYNDAYKAIIGGRHPSALGKPTRQVWPEIWNVIGPMLQTAMGGVRGTYVEEQLLIMERHGFAEETYYTYSYTPVPNDDGQTGGIICANTDDTQRVIGQRQLSTLRELSTATSHLRMWQEVCAKSASALSMAERDLPFALIYILDESGKTVSLAASHALPAGHAAAPQTIDLESGHPWPIREALSSSAPFLVSNIDERYQDLPSGPWPRPPSAAAAVPIHGSGEHGRGGVLVVGLNPFRQLNEDYQAFLSLISAQIGASITVARAYEEERKRAEALAEIDRAKTAFFSNVSHEFRTPLTLMLGPLEELVRQSPVGDTREQLQTIQRNGLRLLKLVNTLLDFSRIEAGRVELACEEVDLSALARDFASAFRSLIEKAGLYFKVECEPMPQPAFVDKDMWEKVIFNLLSNAYKFTLEGGITLKLRSAGPNAILTVSDTGAGIPADELPNIFKRFHRVQNVRARTYEGTGIGLALVHDLVKLHGGDISVHSDPGRGSSFQVTVPLGKAHLSADQLQRSPPNRRIAFRAGSFVDEAEHWNSAPGVPEPSTSAATMPRIIVADDNADMRGYVSRLLRGRYQVEAVSDGAAALSAARRATPAAIVTDIMMPVMDGLELLRCIRQDPALKTVPVILLSARAGDEARLEGIDHQADDYLVKPFSGRELIARLQTHLKLLETRQEAFRTEQHLRDEARKVSDRLESILSSMDDHFLVLDYDFRFLYVNERLLQAYNRSRQELLGKRIWDVFPELASGPFREQVIAAANDRKSTRFEYFYRTGAKWYDNRVSPAPEGLAILATDITERKRAEAALQQAKDELEQRVTDRTASLSQVVAQMEEFSYSVSHDLRAPVRAMQGYAQALLEDFGDRLDNTGREYLNHIVRAGTRMDRLVRDILTYSRLARAEPSVQPVSLDALVPDIISHYPEMQPPRATITLQSQLGQVLAHEPSLTQAISNLLSNAVKFVPPGVTPSVEVSSERPNGNLRLWIRDNGIGIKPEHQGRLFGLFQRIHPDEKYEGTGIGLAVVRKSVERMGGKVGLESSGQGSSFWIELPAASSL